jgi:hypothetical protein
VRSESRCALNVLEVMSTSVYTGLNPFNFIRKHFLQICVRKVAVNLTKGVGNDIHERLYRPEPVPYRSLSAQRLSGRTVLKSSNLERFVKLVIISRDSTSVA